MYQVKIFPKKLLKYKKIRKYDILSIMTLKIIPWYVMRELSVNRYNFVLYNGGTMHLTFLKMPFILYCIMVAVVAYEVFKHKRYNIITKEIPVEDVSICSIN